MLSNEQEVAIGKIKEFIDPMQKDKLVFRLDGYAGTGKTTIAKELRELVNGEVLYGTFTGKAASVLHSKGCLGAQTIHSLIYRSKDKSEEHYKQLSDQLKNFVVHTEEDLEIEYQLMQELKREEDNLSRPSFTLNYESDLIKAKLLVIDEHSMVSAQMGEDLTSFGTKIIAMGDPAQLPPVGDKPFFDRYEADYMLTQIHRQAEDSPIIELATRVRQGRGLIIGDWGSAEVKMKTNLDEMANSNQVLCGKNKTRTYINKAIRSWHGYTSNYPVIGDKLVCLRNNHDSGLLNGTIWYADSAPSWDGDDRFSLCIKNEEGVELNTTMWAFHFDGRDAPLGFRRRTACDEFTYGYALTVHKSQGSQWDSVVIIDESKVFDEADKWMYTAITRAAKNLKVVKSWE